ncbi:hypothetical protein DFJ74DRAFT_665469 [Hyaloraphidium curvatum]|nr:hypothetical protein DFJ74DRAFT_665469 [Hyaloraphidium curvatum]
MRSVAGRSRPSSPTSGSRWNRRSPSSFPRSCRTGRVSESNWSARRRWSPARKGRGSSASRRCCTRIILRTTSSRRARACRWSGARCWWPARLRGTSTLRRMRGRGRCGWRSISRARPRRCGSRFPRVARPIRRRDWPPQLSLRERMRSTCAPCILWTATLRSRRSSGLRCSESASASWRPAWCSLSLASLGLPVPRQGRCSHCRRTRTLMRSGSTSI